MRFILDAIDILARCYPFHQINPQEILPLKTKMETRECKRGQTLLRRVNNQPDKWTYLISGNAELRRSFFDRENLQAGFDPALQPLDYLLLSDGGQIVALDDCTVVQVSRDLLDCSRA
jgi:hypothetical protein